MVLPASTTNGNSLLPGAETGIGLDIGNLPLGLDFQKPKNPAETRLFESFFLRQPGNPNIISGPMALRPCLTTGLPFSVSWIMVLYHIIDALSMPVQYHSSFDIDILSVVLNIFC